MVHSAKIVHHNPDLDKLDAKNQSSDHMSLPLPNISEKGSNETVEHNIYDEETNRLRYNIADYYLFTKNYY